MLVDDHPLIRSGLARIIDLSGEFCVCAEAGSYEEAVEHISNAQPDLIVLDLHLEGKSGFDLLQYNISKQIHVPVLVVSMHDEPLYVERVFKLGAKGYLLKRETIDHVVDALRQIVSGHVYTSDILSENMFKLMNRNGEGEEINPDLLLSRRESEIFLLIANGKNRIEIAELLHISKKTVETHFERIKSKLHVDSSFKLTYRAIKHHLK